SYYAAAPPAGKKKFRLCKTTWRGWGCAARFSFGDRHSWCCRLHGSPYFLQFVGFLGCDSPLAIGEAIVERRQPPRFRGRRVDDAIYKLLRRLLGKSWFPPVRRPRLEGLERVDDKFGGSTLRGSPRLEWIAVVVKTPGGALLGCWC